MDKLKYSLRRLRLGLCLLPRRWSALLRPPPPGVVGTRLTDRMAQLLDALLLADLYEAISNLLSRRLRGLSRREVELLRPLFGDSLPYALVRIDERAWVGPRTGRFCYVGFHTINHWGPVRGALLVHEAVHVWQYVHYGAVYIPRALAAQRSRAGYDYGGSDGLARAGGLADFNFEQMAAVVEDAYRTGLGAPGRYLWRPTARDRHLMDKLVAELATAAMPRAYRTSIAGR